MDLTPQAREDDAWLRERLRERYLGMTALPSGETLVTVEKRDGKQWWFISASAATALRRARVAVEAKFEQAKGTR
jgi:hypothetical protein